MSPIEEYRHELARWQEQRGNASDAMRAVVDSLRPPVPQVHPHLVSPWVRQSVLIVDHQLFGDDLAIREAAYGGSRFGRREFALDTEPPIYGWRAPLSTGRMVVELEGRTAGWVVVSTGWLLVVPVAYLDGTEREIVALSWVNMKTAARVWCPGGRHQQSLGELEVGSMRVSLERRQASASGTGF